MTTANEEFLDLMPHRIRVTGEPLETPEVVYDDFGKIISDTAGSGPHIRTYACLIDDTTLIMRGSDGREIMVTLVAYVAPVPLESADGRPVDIEDTEKIEILSPRPDERPVVGIERHYDSDEGFGQLHNIVLRFQ